jgi:RND family efflux transporter MFP subunit
MLKRMQWLWGLMIVGVIGAAGCRSVPRDPADAQQRQTEQGPAAVDVATAQVKTFNNALHYVGTTEPYRQVSLRPRVEGQLLQLSVDVGDPVRQGQVLAQLDQAVLAPAVQEAQAEVTALEAEVAQARTQVSEALRQVETARLTLQQAQADFTRYGKLAQVGAIPQQQFEQARTQADTAQQSFQAAQAVVRTRQRTVDAAQRRVTAQQAVGVRAQAQLSYTRLVAPVTGVVLERVLDPGNLAPAGSEILKIGDFSQLKVVVRVSELDLSTIRIGQPVEVTLDAFPKEIFRGRIARISPTADATARLLPVEIMLHNPGQRVGGGLLARVQLSRRARAVVVPETALQPFQKRGKPDRKPAATTAPRQSGTLFVITGTGKQATIASRQVTLGQRQDGQVEVSAGLQPGDRFVVRSNKALKDGDSVRLSILSE